MLKAPEGMRRFTMRREHDVSGVSGTGTVVEGVQFSTGVVVIHWLTPPPRGSISIFDSIEQFLSIHVLPHPDNRTVLTFEDGEEMEVKQLAQQVTRRASANQAPHAPLEQPTRA